jgi:hypothetical protein
VTPKNMVYSEGRLIKKPWAKGESMDALRWHISWTGWKGSATNWSGPKDDTLVGQWLAWDRRDSRYYYASVPGGEGEYRRGECFDINPEGKPEQVRITRSTPLGTALEMYERGYQRLLKALEAHGVDTRAVYEEKL